MPRLAICSRDLHWQWINWAPLYDTMEVSMLHLAWLTVAQHVFQPALTGRLELISRKIVSCEPGTKAIAVSRFREKLSPANWVQGVTAISRKMSRSWSPKNGVQHATAIYPIPRYTRPRYIGLTLYSEALDNGTDHNHSKSCCDQRSPARRTMTSDDYLPLVRFYHCNYFYWGLTPYLLRRIFLVGPPTYCKLVGSCVIINRVMGLFPTQMHKIFIGVTIIIFRYEYKQLFNKFL